MTHDDFAVFVREHDWRVAKTMPGIPHSYTLKKHADERFESAVQFIRENGYTQQFYGRDYTYYDIDDQQFWTMGAPVDETTLINRAAKSPEDA